MKRIGLILIIGLLVLFVFNANVVFAGFGVSPSGVTNHHLLPGSHFERVIYLVQGKPEKDLLAKIEVDAEEIKDWISFDRGFEFTIPAGIQQFPMKVRVDVPQDAEFKNYRGRLWVKTSAIAKEGEEGTAVAISLGAIVQLDLTVSLEEIYGFAFRGINIQDIEKGRPIKVIIKLENVGNIENGPSLVHLDVQDPYTNKVIQSNDTTKLPTIKPFATKQFVVKFPNKLAMGGYFGEVTIYKDKHTISNTKQSFKVGERTGILYKIFSRWYSWVILWAVILAILGWKKRKKIKRLLKRWKAKKLEKKRSKIEKKLRKLGM